MLSFEIVFADGSAREVVPITAVMNCELEVPADEITVTCRYDREISENADYINVFCDGELIFKGQIDEIADIKDENGVITRISARSLAGMLLDNEAEPVTYINPAPEFIYLRHLKPFGIDAFTVKNTPFYGHLKIDKGMSHWQVFQNFCKNLYGTMPRISGDGKAYFEGVDSKDKVVLESNAQKSDYYSLKAYNKRYKLISGVKVRLDEFGTYSSYIKNENPDCKKIRRERYVNAAADTSSIETADKVIANSNKSGRIYLAESAGCHIGLIGKRAVIDDDVFGKIDNLTVAKTAYTLNKDGEFTSITLIKI